MEFIRYAGEGMKWLAIGGGSYISFIFGCQIYDAWPFHKKIQSKEELENVINKECDELGINPAEIEPVFKQESSNYLSNYIIRIDKAHKWELHVKGNWQSTRNTIRHELYHFLKDAQNWRSRSKLNKFFYYLLVAEPRATLYGTFGIKL